VAGIGEAAEVRAYLGQHDLRYPSPHAGDRAEQLDGLGVGCQAAGLRRLDLQIEEPLQDLRRGASLGQGLIQFGAQVLGRGGQAQVGQVPVEPSAGQPTLRSWANSAKAGRTGAPANLPRERQPV
jgi:hypothetical protein